MEEIKLSGPDITQKEKDLIGQVLDTPDLSMGPMLEKFEESMARFIGTNYAAGVSSGTAGLHLCMIAAGIGEGDEVITTPFSFIASANCILYERAKPVFVDIEQGTLNIDVSGIEEKIPPQTKAILPVHAFGQPCRMDELLVVAQKHKLLVIEDACEAIGAEFKGKKAGSFGDAAVFAFYPNKQMTTGEGGIIVTSNTEWRELFKSLRNQGRGEGGGWLDHIRLGYNYRLDEMSAALGVAQLSRIDELLEKREKVASWYNEQLNRIEGIKIPYIDPMVTKMSWFVYVIQLMNGNRDKVMNNLQKMGIPSRPYFIPIHLQPVYVERFGYKMGDFPVTEEVGRRTLALPFYGNLSKDKVTYICESLQKAIQGK